MKVLALAGDVDALIADIRLRTPLQALATRMGWTLQLTSLHACTRADLASAQALVVQRAFSRRAWRWMRRMRLQGGAVLYDIDDLLTDLPSHVSNQAAVQARQQELRLCLAEADLVTVSTERLGRALGCPRWQVVPNSAMVLAHDEAQPAVATHGPVNLIFASMDKLADTMVLPALRALQEQQQGLFQVVVIGPAAAMFEAAGLQVRALPLMPRVDFLQFVRGLPQPLAVIPLEDSLFASCKSAIKWMDYAAAGIPCLCSRVSPYIDVVQHDQTGALVANDPSSWQAALHLAMRNSDWRRRVGAGARHEVLARHTLEHSVDAWRDAVELACQHRGPGRLEPPEARWRLQEAAGASAERLVQGLRNFNRARLAKRQAQRLR